MISEAPDFAALAAFGAQACVIGGGPVGIVTALALARRGRRVLLLESGGRAAGAAAQALSQAENLDPATHHAPEITVARRLGGASNLWGGRCLPFDPIDFAARPWLADWAACRPGRSAPDDLAPWLGEACPELAAGDPVFAEPLPGVAADPAFGFESLERWSNRPRIQELHGAELAARPELMVALGTTVTGFEDGADGRIAAALAHVEGRGRGRIAAPLFVLAAGGNESTRLLLAAQAQAPERFGGPEGPLGRCYMGHVNGTIADVVLEDPALHDGLDFHVDGHGSYVRRRLVPSPERRRRPASATSPSGRWCPRRRPSHRSGPLSATFLALSVGPLGRRLIAEPIRLKHVGRRRHTTGGRTCGTSSSTCRGPSASRRPSLEDRVARLRLPGFFLRNPARRYGLEYHAEQLPDRSSRLTLAAATDRLGPPRLRIRLAFAPADAAAVVRAHEALGDWLRRNRLGRLEHRHGERGRGRRRCSPRPGTATTRSAPSAWGSTGGARSSTATAAPSTCRTSRRLDRGAADLGPGQPDADRGAARPAPRRPAGRRGLRGCPRLVHA